jgi:hypothetical protein
LEKQITEQQVLISPGKVVKEATGKQGMQTTWTIGLEQKEETGMFRLSFFKENNKLYFYRCTLIQDIPLKAPCLSIEGH